MAAFDLLSRGFDCFPAAQGMPYDLVADINGSLLRIQVKTTRKPQKMPNRENMVGYGFHVRKCGKMGRSAYTKNDVDMFALVALDVMEVGYVSVGQMPVTLMLRASYLKGTYFDEKIVARNKVIYDRLVAGENADELAAEFGLDQSYVRRLRFGRARTFVSGFYLSDLTLESALSAIASNDNARIGSSKKSFLDQCDNDS